MAEKKQLALAWQVLIGLAAGILVGLLVGKENADFLYTWIHPLGNLIFMNLLKFIVVPIVLFSIAAGIISLKDVRKVGSIGGKTIVFYLCTTAVAVIIGLVVVNIFKGAGAFPPIDTNTDAILNYVKPDDPPHALTNLLTQIFPANSLAPMVNNAMLQVITISLLLGFGITFAGEKGLLAASIVESLNEVFMKIMSFIIKLSPYAVFCLIAPVIARNGADFLGPLALVILAAYIAYILHLVLVYSSLVGVVGKMSPLKFFKGMLPAMLLAYSCASSVGTLPVTMECTKKLGVKEEISNFTLPLGATINMDGTAIYQGVAAIFIAACFGMELTLMNMLAIVLTATLASIGTAGVPGAGMVMLAMVLLEIGVPVEGIAIIAGVDRIFDMGRTCLNITGDAACSVIINRMEGKKEAKKAAVA